MLSYNVLNRRQCLIYEIEVLSEVLQLLLVLLLHRSHNGLWIYMKMYPLLRLLPPLQHNKNIIQFDAKKIARSQISHKCLKWPSLHSGLVI